MSFSLIVTDTSPLITLAVADSLESLLRIRLPIQIPDAVYAEATRNRTAAGASRIAAWINDNPDQVRIVPTEAGIDQQRRLEEGRSIRGMGEQAAIEALDDYLARHPEPEAKALLLFEDSDVIRRRAVIDSRVGLISTGDMLRELEHARLIQSADHVLDRAAQAGRNVQRQRMPAEDEQARTTLRQQLTGVRKG